ncbi:MAG: hypothetical protein ACTSWY_04825 [Promethearchaeota archaeon]
MNNINFFEKVFFPKTLAFIGANPRRYWHLMGYITRFPKDSLYIVSKYGEEFKNANEDLFKDIKIYKDISEIPDKIDHTVISINRNNLLDVIKKCLEKKFYTIHIFSAGTGEFDKKGFEIETELYNMFKNNPNSKLVGPNCMGVYSPRGKFSYSGGFSETAGNFSLVSQSGDLTNKIVGTLNHRGIFFSGAVSIGNSISLRAPDFINYYNQDDNTEVILSYLEGFSPFRKSEHEGRILFNTLKQNKKPLLILKGGISDLGKRAASSHTGSLASDNQIWNSIFKQTNAIPIESYDELIDTAVMFRFCLECEPKVNSVLMMTYSGGSSVLGVDAIARLGAGVDVPAIQEPTHSKMKKMINVGSITNPLDLPMVRDEEIRYNLFKSAIEESYIGGAIYLTSGPKSRFRDADDDTIKKYYSNLKKYKDTCTQLGKPFMIYLPYMNDGEFNKKLIELEIPSFPSFERAAKAFSNLYRYKNSKRIDR